MREKGRKERKGKRALALLCDAMKDNRQKKINSEFYSFYSEGRKEGYGLKHKTRTAEKLGKTVYETNSPSSLAWEGNLESQIQ